LELPGKSLHDLRIIGILHYEMVGWQIINWVWWGGVDIKQYSESITNKKTRWQKQQLHQQISKKHLKMLTRLATFFQFFFFQILAKRKNHNNVISVLWTRSRKLPNKERKQKKSCCVIHANTIYRKEKRLDNKATNIYNVDH
jgi:hypothetical protein